MPKALTWIGLSTALALGLGALQTPAQAQSVAPSDAPITTATQKGSGAPPTAVGQSNEVQSVQGDPDADLPPANDGKPHGYVQVGAGNHGYREISGAVTVPVGDDGQATIAIDNVQGDGLTRRR